MTELRIPAELLPVDGRFGSGPAKVRRDALAGLAGHHDVMGTSHRQAPVKNLVGSVQAKLAELYRLPDDYAVVLGNGGATLFWDIAACSLVRERSSHAVLGEFSKKFADAAKAAPFLTDPLVTKSPVGSAALPVVDDSVDVLAWPQNETSTGACLPVVRPEGASADQLVVVDATSSAGGMAADIAATDAYYFAPQKNFSSDGGLWLAFCSPAALERSAQLTSSGRWVPALLDLTQAAENSAKQQTLNTPAIATLLLLDATLTWMLAQGGLDFVTQRTATSSNLLYEWADAHELAAPFVTERAHRSPVVATIDFDDRVDSKKLLTVLRANGVVDIDPYRSLGRNQIRVGVFASVDPDDVRALIKCVDWVLERIV